MSTETPSLAQLILDEVWTTNEPDPDKPTPEAGQAPTPEPTQTPASDPAPTPTATVATTAGDDSGPVWTGQEEAGRSFAAQQKQLRDAESAASYWRGQAEARAQPATPAAKPVDLDPEPDPEQYPDSDDGNVKLIADQRAWDRRQAKREVMAELAPTLTSLQEERAQTRWDNSWNLAEARLRDQWQPMAAWVNQMQAHSKGFAADLNAATDPGKYAESAWRMATGQAAGTPQALAAAPAATKAELMAQAAAAAARGDTPDTPTGPRGIGSGPASAGPSDDLTPEAIRNIRDPQRLAKLSRSMMGDWFTDSDSTEWPPKD